jgi:hypothetical protein
MREAICFTDIRAITLIAFEDRKWVIRRRESKDRQYNGKKKKVKGQTTIYKTLHRKLKIE